MTELGFQIEPHDFRGAETVCSHVYSDGTKCNMSVWQHTKQDKPCQRFTGLRQWGIGPAEPWRICQNCGWPKAQHELPSCAAILNIAGKSYACELNDPHQGWGHSNKEAQALWTGNDIEGKLRAAEIRQSVMCPVCHDLYVPQGGTVPEHFLDTQDNATRCTGSLTAGELVG